MDKTIVIAGDRVFLKFLDMGYFEERAREAGARLVALRSAEEEEFRRSLAEADAVIVIDRTVGREHFALMRRARVVLALTVGYDCIDVAAASERGVPVCHVPAYCTEEVALHALALILALSRRLPELWQETARGGWDYKAGAPAFLLSGRKLGIVGLGRIGRALAPKARGLGLEVLAYDPYLADDLFALLGVHRRYELDELLAEADIVSLHVPLSAETRGLIGSRELALMKRTALLVNTCRGPVVEEAALVRALKEKRIAGAGVDVLAKEPPEANHPLLGLSGALVTPHAAWYSEESMQRVKVQGMDEVVGVLSGKRPRHIVNPQVLARGRG